MGARKLDDDFYARVYDVVREIPEGKVTTYGAIARYLGLRSSARIIGYALHMVADDMGIPCHRVVNRNGELTGKRFFATPTLMRDLLEEEGVGFSGEGVMMSEHFWDPSDALVQEGLKGTKRSRNKKTPR